jgi:hypothetical protein
MLLHSKDVEEQSESIHASTAVIHNTEGKLAQAPATRLGFFLPGICDLESQDNRTLSLPADHHIWRETSKTRMLCPNAFRSMMSLTGEQ